MQRCPGYAALPHPQAPTGYPPPTVPDEPQDRFDRLFRAAQLYPSGERAAFLRAACADDPSLREALESLLDAGGDADLETFLGTHEAEALIKEVLTARADDVAGWVIGPYTVLRRLGRGGMGDVFLANREAPYKRYVALKVIRRGVDTHDVRARFNIERQILASLNHPNIARLIDGGMTEAQGGDPGGLPYFAMEYVEGLPITDYCDTHRLGLDERLNLFQTICQAVHFAHQNLILHRDLKPSNILVTPQGQVKLLDFGIAKLLNPSMSPMTLPVTRTELRLMTPGYASPEQVRGETLTTASDVYSLGVILYELLTGHRPYYLTHGSPDEVIRLVCEQVPERPSTRIMQTEEITGSDGTTEITPERVSTARNAPPERLRRRLRGDLDNIVLMALRKEAPRRYPSVEQFSRDLERYLEGLPVSARPSTLGYRARKFIQRHRAAVGAATVATAALVIGLAVALWQAGEARQERDRSALALRHSEAVTDFLVDLFEASDPLQARGGEITARELLERGAERAQGLTGQPAVEAQMLVAMGRVYRNLGQYDRAEQLFDRALALNRDYAGTENTERATILAHRADVLRLRGNYPEAEAAYEQALALQRTLLDAGGPQAIGNQIGLGRVLLDWGDFERAEPIYREALAAQQALLGAEHPEVIRTQSQLAQVLQGKGDYAAAEATLQETLALREKLYDRTHPEVALNLIQLASLYANRDDFERSEALHRRALTIQEQVYGGEHPAVAKSLTHVATSLLFQGRPDEAEPLLRRALGINRAALGASHPDVGTTLNTLALLLADRRAFDEAETLFQEALANYRWAFGERHHYTAAIIGNLANIAEERGDLRKAEAYFLDAFAIRAEALGNDHPYTLGTKRQVAGFFLRQERFPEAESYFLEALEAYRTSPDAEERIRTVHRELAGLYEAWGKLEEAARHRALLE